MYCRFEKVFTVGLLFYFTGGLLPYLLPSADGLADKQDGSLAGFAVQGAVASLAFILATVRWREVLSGILSAKWLLLLVLLAFLSTLWSDSPGLTARRSTLLASTTIFGVYYAVRFSRDERLRLLLIMLAIAAALSIAFALFVPNLGISHDVHEGDWRGIFFQKNGLARLMVLSAVTCVLWKPQSTYEALCRWSGFLVSCGLVYTSGSRTGVLVLFALLLLLPLCSTLRWKPAEIVPVAMLIALVGMGTAYVAINHSEWVLLQLGRDASITGRTGIWHSLLIAIARRPWLGYGFSAFWRGLQGESSSVILSVRWAVQQAHNGFLDLALDLGLIGLAVYLCGFVTALICSIRLIRSSKSSETLWPLVFLAFTVLYNFTESGILKTSDIFWVLYVVTAVTLSYNERPIVDLTHRRIVHSHETKHHHIPRTIAAT